MLASGVSDIIETEGNMSDNKNRKFRIISKGVNREYKDRLFKFIFGNPANKEWTLSLYNAVNSSSYTNPDDIKFTTIEEAVYMNMKNDVSFLITDQMNFYEQQASFNPNMPMRFFIYGGMVYSKYIETSKSYHRFSAKLQKAPTPKCVCFYNGTSEKEDKVVLKLSDALGPESDFEAEVTMINVNYGHNSEILKACKPLEEYSYFVDKVRTYQKSTDELETALDKALDELPDDFLIKPFLTANRAEVKIMCITEYDEERTLNEACEEAYDEGHEDGYEEGAVSAFAGLVKDGILSLAEAARRANMTESEFELKSGLNP